MERITVDRAIVPRKTMRPAAGAALLLVILAVFLTLTAADVGPTGEEPRYTAGGELRRPVGYEEWVFVGASLGLSYSEHARPSGSDTFHHVYP